MNRNDEKDLNASLIEALKKVGLELNLSVGELLRTSQNPRPPRPARERTDKRRDNK